MVESKTGRELPREESVQRPRVKWEVGQVGSCNVLAFIKKKQWARKLHNFYTTGVNNIHCRMHSEKVEELFDFPQLPYMAPSQMYGMYNWLNAPNL